MARHNFHNTAFGWNYFFEFAQTGKIRFGRYHTNGHVNTNQRTTIWVDAKLAEIDISDCQSYAKAAESGQPITETTKYNANLECQKAFHSICR